MDYILEFNSLGLVSYNEAREIQEERLKNREGGNCPDTIYFCEHHPVITLGKRAKPEHFLCSKAEICERGIEIIRVHRGGGATYHGPGQLIIYPVISLRERKLSLRFFILLVLDIIERVLNSFGLPAKAKLQPAGVWIEDFQSSRKIASVGLHISHGITNHGFAINLSCDLMPFSLFYPCGHKGLNVTSLKLENCAIDSILQFQSCLKHELSAALLGFDTSKRYIEHYIL
jgi:lipoyl(octanoyl) transferase